MKEILIDEMNKPKVLEAILDSIKEFDDIELVELKYFKEFGKNNLSVLIWKKEGISLDDCEKVHNKVSQALDNIQDLFLDEYVLNVSSQGLDREIKTNDDLRRALDTEIQIFEGKKKSHGVLSSYDDESIVIIHGEKQQERNIKRNNITKIQPYIRF